VNDRIFNMHIWKAFFAQAPTGAYRAFVHCKSRECNPEMLTFLPMLRPVNRKPTSRCLDLVTAEAQLMKVALKTYVSGADVLQKYIILTESTLPVKPFSVVYDTLTRHRESDFCFFNDQWWPKTHLQCQTQPHKGYASERRQESITAGEALAVCNIKSC